MEIGTHDNPKNRFDPPDYRAGDYVEMFISRNLNNDDVTRDVVQIDECLDNSQFAVRYLGSDSTTVVDISLFRW